LNTKKSYKQNFSLENLPGEKWEDLPRLDGVCQISNYGRVKSLRRWVERSNVGGFWKKERILTNIVQVQEFLKGKNKCYLLRISIGFEGKKYSFLIGRTVYYLFVKKFKLEDRRILTAYKDGDSFNVHYSNLILTSSSTVVVNSYQTNRRSRERFGMKPKTVIQYDKEGKEITTYPSISQAAKLSGINLNTIVGQLNNGIGYTGGFIWKYKKEIKNKEIVTTAIRNKMASVALHTEIVTQYDLTGKKLREFENLNSAAKGVKVQPNHIRMVLLGKLSSTAGYYWQLGSGEKEVSVENLWEGRKKWRERICRPVTQYDMEGNFVDYFLSITAAAEQTGILGMTIFSALKDGGSRTCKGFIFRYGKGRKKISVPERVKKKLYLEDLFSKPVTQYTLDGKRVAVHVNLKDAAKKVKGQLYGLVAVIEGKRLSFKGFCWRLGKGGITTNVDEVKNTEEARRKKISRPVIQYSLAGKKISEFASIKEAAFSTGTSTAQIGAVARGKYKAAKGYKWKYKK
jgi:NUMOD1 domain/NUMOD4 motif